MAKFTIPNVQADHVLAVAFKAVAKFFNIAISASVGGTVSPLGDTSVQQGDTLVVDMVPANGFELDSILLDGVPQSPDPA